MLLILPFNANLPKDSAEMYVLSPAVLAFNLLSKEAEEASGRCYPYITYLNLIQFDTKRCHSATIFRALNLWPGLVKTSCRLQIVRHLWYSDFLAKNNIYNGYWADHRRSNDNSFSPLYELNFIGSPNLFLFPKVDGVSSETFRFNSFVFMVTFSNSVLLINRR